MYKGSLIVDFSLCCDLTLDRVVTLQSGRQDYLFSHVTQAIKQHQASWCFEERQTHSNMIEKKMRRLSVNNTKLVLASCDHLTNFEQICIG